MNLLLGDSLEVLKGLEENSVDAVVTDPPYGLSFMGKKWDYQVPSVELWAEVLRVLKPGGHVLSFGGTRTYHRMVVNMEDAGFEIRDQVQWLYGSGFPKSHNMPGGIGTALKPANEPICLARKPISEKTVAANVLLHGTGGLNIDASRIESNGDHMRPFQPTNNEREIFGKQTGFQPTNAPGRWPANIILDESAAEALDEQSGQLSQCGGPKKTTHDAGMFGIGTPGRIYKEENRGASRFFYVAKASKKERNAGLEVAGVLDECRHNECDTVCTMPKTKQGNRPGSPDMTGKFPDHDHRPSGGNNHPTVKPIKLMEYLIKLITPPGGVVLDPFMGSGTTGVAAKNLDFKFIGIEREEAYINIAKGRISNG